MIGTKIALLALLAILVTSLHVQRQHQRVISKKCCQKLGGFECGKFNIACCAVQNGKNKCVTGFFYSNCPSQKVITTSCGQNCNNVCRAKGGAPCTPPNQSPQENVGCCSSENCIISEEKRTETSYDRFMNEQLNEYVVKEYNCKPGTTISLPQCSNL